MLVDSEHCGIAASVEVARPRTTYVATGGNGHDSGNGHHTIFGEPSSPPTVVTQSALLVQLVQHFVDK